MVMKLQNKTIGMLLGPSYEDLEFWVVYMRMIEEGAKVITIGLKKDETYMSKHGCLSAQCEMSAEEVSADELDAVCVPGGWAPDKMRRDKAIIKLVHDVYSQGKIVGLICHAGLVGISAGIVKDKKATGSAGIKDDLISAGAQWIDEPAFRDGNIVWGRVVKDIPDYCRELVKAISDES
jgi:protease I